jgi:hypothetical protein
LVKENSESHQFRQAQFTPASTRSLAAEQALPEGRLEPAAEAVHHAEKFG